MPVEFRNITLVKAFVKNMEDLPNSSKQAADAIADSMRTLIINRVAQSQFLGGRWGNKPYSSNPIKAHKLGNSIVTGKGMGKRLTINGILIDRNDWYWGEWDMEQKGISLSSGRGANVKDSFHGRNPGKPSPVFVPGYRGWRVKYHGLPSNVDLDFSGQMLDHFFVDVHRARGSNQYGDNWAFRFEVNEPFYNIGEITDYYRQWLTLTEDEVQQAIKESGAEVSSILAV